MAVASNQELLDLCTAVLQAQEALALAVTKFGTDSDLYTAQYNAWVAARAPVELAQINLAAAIAALMTAINAN